MAKSIPLDWVEGVCQSGSFISMIWCCFLFSFISLPPHVVTNFQTTTGPHQSFNSKVAQIFAPRGTPANTQIPVNMTTITTLPINDHPQERLPIGAITGDVVGGFVLVIILLTTVLFLPRRRQHMASLPQQPPELPSTPFNPQELQDTALYELQHDQGRVFELPIGPDGSVPEKE